MKRKNRAKITIDELLRREGKLLCKSHKQPYIVVYYGNQGGCPKLQSETDEKIMTTCTTTLDYFPEHVEPDTPWPRR